MNNNLYGEDFDFESRIVSSSVTSADGDTEVSLRPKSLEDYVGQSKVKDNLNI